MVRHLRFGVFCALALMLLIPGAVQAKGAPARVIITGPGLAHPLDVRGLAVGALGWYSLDDERHPLRTAPRQLGPGYLVTRYDIDGSTKRYFAWDHVRYYPNPRGGGRATSITSGCSTAPPSSTAAGSRPGRAASVRCAVSSRTIGCI